MAMNTYGDFNDFLGKRERKKLKGNTWVERNVDPESIGIRLHGTVVVEYFPDGKIKLDTGGWETNTTKKRINEFSPFSVWHEKFVLFIDGPGLAKTKFSNKMIVEVP